MNTQLYCPDETRKARVRAETTLNGIDYLEVLDDDAPAGSPPQRTLLVHCFQPVTGLSQSNARIEGGARVRDVGVLWAHPADAIPAGLLNAAEQAYLGDSSILPDPARVLVIRTNSAGDFSTYTLRLIRSSVQPDLPPTGFDAPLASVEFSFKVDCPSDFDCRQAQDCPAPPRSAPHIDYLAKDYASFRRLMLDRLAVIMPDWQERNPADVGIALVELLAYAADHLSYYQDAVATEAYLGTARRRSSVRRHARLVDYRMHDGANARAWIHFDVEAGTAADGAELPAGTRILSHDHLGAPTLPTDALERALQADPIVFETLHAARLSSARNAIPFYAWGDPNCCLPTGATHATLRGAAADLGLAAGDVLIFEEVLGAESGRDVDADPSHRHAVRLRESPSEQIDPLTGETVITIAWHAEDALPFPLCLREFPDGNGGVQGVSVARGNVVLADHGLTLIDQELIPPIAPVDGRRYRPRLERLELTQRMPYRDSQARQRSAAAAMSHDPRRALPAIALTGDGETWTPQRDLLNSDRFAAEFVVETESDGRAFLRFGDGVLGRQPSAGARLTATYRIGNGSRGNVGSDALTCVVTDLTGIDRARNPLPATGGAAPESLERVKLFAPQAFRTQERAVTEADYAAMAQRHPEVQRAAATRRWTGSWYTMFVTVDRVGGREVDADFETELRAFLERFRMAGYDLEIDAPRFVALDLALKVCVAPGYFRSNVKQALLEAFSNRDLPDGRRGFFHPDNFTFGQPVYLSQIIAAAMRVPGVDSVAIDRFQRWGEDPHGEIDDGRITLSRLEIARLDNDPSLPEHGRIELQMLGGL